MIVTREESQTSDNDGSERPVRRKLKETSITSVPPSSNPVSESQDGGNSRAGSRGRKRSFNEDEAESNEDDPGHRRKRSRSSNVEEDKATPAETDTAAKESPSNIMSPKKKRSRDQLDKEEPKAEGAADKKVSEDAAKNGVSTENATAEGEPEKKRHRDDSQERDSVSYNPFFSGKHVG